MTLKSTLALLILTTGAITLSADQITLKNGDRITGAIVKKDGNNLTVKSDLMGTVTIPWDKIADIKTNEPLNVILAGQPGPEPPVIKATIASSDGKITLSAAQGAPQTVDPAGIAAIRDNAEEATYEKLLHSSLLELWTG